MKRLFASCFHHFRAIAVGEDIILPLSIAPIKRSLPMILTSGGDTHEPETVACGGIATETRIQTPTALCDLLLGGSYTLLKP